MYIIPFSAVKHRVEKVTELRDQEHGVDQVSELQDQEHGVDMVPRTQDQKHGVEKVPELQEQGDQMQSVVSEGKLLYIMILYGINASVSLDFL